MYCINDSNVYIQCVCNVVGVSDCYNLSGIMLILWLGLPSEYSGLLVVDICEIQHKLVIFGDISLLLRI